jgi:hypothetical protein
MARYRRNQVQGVPDKLLVAADEVIEWSGASS